MAPLFKLLDPPVIVTGAWTIFQWGDLVQNGVNPRTAGGCLASPSFFFNNSVAHRKFILRFGVFLEPSKNTPTRYRITSPEVKVVWMNFW